MKLLILVSFAITAMAQTIGGNVVVGPAIVPAPAGPQSTAIFLSSPDGSGRFGRVLTGMPYSAEEVTERVQTLADGTRITQPSGKTIVYRDSLGRTRTERNPAMPQGAAGAGIAPAFIELTDPVNGTRYMLDERAHVARQMMPPPPPPPPAPGSVSVSPVRRLPQASGPAAVSAPRDSASVVKTPRPEFSRESLGTQSIEGVLAQGARTTIVYPVGFFGNDRPVTTVSEIWTSPELKVIVLTKTSDPRTGESITRLTNISRAEPDPVLFQIPSDYQVIDPRAATPMR